MRLCVTGGTAYSVKQLNAFKLTSIKSTHNEGPRLEENSQWKTRIVERTSVAPSSETF